MSKLTLANKKQLITFLEIIQLKGLDPRGKENSNFNNCLLSFREDDDGEPYMTSFGRNEGNSIFFNHELYYDSDHFEEMDIPIPDIKLWQKYISDLNGDTVTIKIDAGFIYLEGSDASYYQIPETDRQSIPSFASMPNGPIITWDGDVPNTELRNMFEDEPISDEEWSMFKFDPTKLAEATDSGKNIETLTTQFTIRKNRLDIQVGNLPQAGVGPKFVKNDVEGITNLNWTWGPRDEKMWIGVMGVNPACRALSLLNVGKPVFMYKAPEKNLLFMDGDASYGGKPAMLIWLISPVAQHEGTFIDTNQDVPQVGELGE